jgi:transposase
MKALDGDLRERILRAVDRGEPMPRIAARFEVGLSTVKKWKRRRRETGAAEPLTHRCGRKRALSSEEGDRLAGLVTEDPSLTLGLLRAELGVGCCLTAIWNELRRRGFSHKKSRPTRPSRAAPTSPLGVRRGVVNSGGAGAGSIPSGSCSSTRPARRRT